MKMNKLVKGLLVGFIALQMVGCEEAKEVENLNIQDTNPVVEEVKPTCKNCGFELLEEDALNKFVAETQEYIANEKDEERAHVLQLKVNALLKYNGCNMCADTEVLKGEEKVEAPVVKEEPKEVAHDEDIEPCVICGEFEFKKDMIRMGDGYYDEFCYNEVTKVEEEVEATPEIIEKAVSIDNCEACGTTNIEWMTNWDYMCHDCGHCGSVN